MIETGQEVLTMSARAEMGSTRRFAFAVAMAGLAGLALSVLPVGAEAAASRATAVNADMASARLTDVSAAKRKRARRSAHRHGSSAAGMAFMGMAMGMIGSAIAESQRRDYYDHYYGYRPRYYYGGGHYGRPFGYHGYYGRPGYRYYGY
jgi:hypothetical protein